jgi:hypothetical protein
MVTSVETTMYGSPHTSISYNFVVSILLITCDTEIWLSYFFSCSIGHNRFRVQISHVLYILLFFGIN